MKISKARLVGLSFIIGLKMNIEIGILYMMSLRVFGRKMGADIILKDLSFFIKKLYYRKSMSFHSKTRLVPSFKSVLEFVS